uniref:Speckle-type POZ protein (inferred by orthology to a human protein) n=1 Tax=Strongyloides venezuelensis TaxID=75913 RepID=A0A0K0FI16_STRVS
MSLEDSLDSFSSNGSGVDSNNNNGVKRVHFMRTLENFPILNGPFRACGISNPYRSNSCSGYNLCHSCSEKKLIMENGHISKFHMDFGVGYSLIVYPNGKLGESKDHVSILLQFDELAYLKIIALCKFSILSVNGKEEYKSVTGVEKFDANKKSYYLQRFIDRRDLFQRQSILSPGNRLTVCFEIFYVFCDDVNTSAVLKTTYIKEPLNVFLNDMSGILNSSEFYDCTIKIGDAKIDVHKCILACRSEVFHEMLKDKSSQHELVTIEIENFTTDAVKEMVNYLYTGRSPKIDEMPFQMLDIAQKYKLEGLKTIATESLFKNLNVENVCEYLEISELCSAEILREFCIRYIYLNAREVTRNEKWIAIVNSYPLLIDRIFKIAVNAD